MTLVSICIDSKQDKDKIKVTFNLLPQPVAKTIIAKELHGLSCGKCSDVC